LNTTALPETGLSPVCRHHWVIDTPNGAVSAGSCKRCGATREFKNASDEAPWLNDGFSLSGSIGRARRGDVPGIN